MNVTRHPSVSAVILARNEEHNIRYCLTTVRWCDEIIVVDMESSDRTIAIASEFTDKIFSYPRVPAFDIAKKYGVEKAIGEWILLIDADEMIPPALAESLMACVKRNDADVIKIPFNHYILGDWVRNSGWGYSPLPRLFRAGSMRFDEQLHGYMHIVDNARVQCLEPHEGACIIHFNYTDSSHFVEKLNRYTSVEADHLYERQEPFSSYALLRSALRAFFGRYIKGKGYKDGVRGFSLSMMMAFYNALTYVKLWERYEFKDDSVGARYDRLRCNLLNEWNNRRP
jgi:glycosyltransferase involved in cell wall biosynthesis